MKYDNGAVMDGIFRKIREYDSIVLFRHRRVDGDCVGATRGFERMLKLTWPEKRVRISDAQSSSRLAFAGMEGILVPEEELKEALGIVLDSADRERVSDKRFLSCREVIKIDHHIEKDPYGDVNWVEEERSSVCEMCAAFYSRYSDTLRLDGEGAGYFFMGMVTDSGRFRFSGTDGDTLRLAGMLLDLGVDTGRLYSNLYLRDLNEWKYRAWVYQNMTAAPGGCVRIYIDKKIRERFNLDAEAAAAVVSLMENIKGCLVWLAFIETDGRGDPRPPQEPLRPLRRPGLPLARRRACLCQRRHGVFPGGGGPPDGGSGRDVRGIQKDAYGLDVTPAFWTESAGEKTKISRRYGF